MSKSSGEPIWPEGDYCQVWHSFNKLRLEGQLCDAVIKAGRQSFPVHRAIMAANSPYFRALFTSQTGDPERTEIELPDTNESTMNIIIEYIYTREVRVNNDNVFDVLPQAENFHMQGLVDLCCLFLASMLNPVNCITLLRFAQKYKHKELIKTVMKFMMDFFKDIYQANSDFTSLEPEEIIDFICEDELNLKAEEDAWEAVVKWINFNPEERKQYFPKLLRCLRLGCVDYNYLVEKIATNQLCKKNKECMSIIRKAKNFLRQEHGTRTIDLMNWLVRPRIPREVLFVIGGWCGGTPISLFESYDTRADRWITHPTLEDTAPRAYHGMVALDNQIYVIGGFDGTQYYNSMKSFNPVTKKWKDLAPMYSARCYVSTATAQGNIYACGGYDGRWRLNTAERYNPKTNQWTQLAHMNCRRSDAGADSINHKIYIMGGFDGDQCLNSAEVYDPQIKQWSVIREMTSIRSGVAVVTYHDVIYAIGGFDGEQRLVTGEKYNPTTGHWTQIADTYAPRSNCCVAVLDDLIFVIGGFNGSATISQVECYDDETNDWYDATDMNVTRSALKACVLKYLPNVRDYTHHGHIVNVPDPV